MGTNQIILEHNNNNNNLVSILGRKFLGFSEEKSMINGISRERFKKVKWVPDDKLCQVKLFQSEDCPSKIQDTIENHHQSKSSRMLHSSVIGFDDAPPGFGGEEYSDIPKRSIPQAQWNPPPVFIMSSDWRVVAGEESKEKEAQKYREFGELEAVYPRACSIPESPLPPNAKECDYDDGETPLIPLIPIEDVDALRNDSPPCSSSGATSQGVVSVNSSQQNLSGMLKAMVDEKPVGVSNGVNSDVAAASAAFTEVVKTFGNGSMVDTDLLMRILSDPKLVDLLPTYAASATPRVSPIEPKPLVASTSFPIKGCHTSPFQVQTVPVPNTKPHVVTSSLRANGNSNQFSNYPQPSSQSSTSVSVSELPFQSHPTPSMEPRPILSKFEDVNRPLQATTSSNLGSETTTLSTLWAALQGKSNCENSVNGRSEFARTVTPTSNSHIFGPNASPLNLFTQPDRYPPQNPVKFDDTKAFSPNKPKGLLLNMDSSVRQENQMLPSETHSTKLPMQSSFSEPPFSSISTPAVKDVNYYKSLIRLHGMGCQESQPEYTSQYQSIVSEPSAVSRQADAPAKIKKPCRFFNGSSGCKRGSSCPFEHVSSVKRAGNVSDADSMKRFKFSG